VRLLPEIPVVGYLKRMLLNNSNGVMEEAATYIENGK
jgi:hypothetical protein